MEFQLHIVTHCYAERLPQYAAFLRYQLMSLFEHPHEVGVLIEVCSWVGDGATNRVLDGLFRKKVVGSANTAVVCQNLSPEMLFRRSIGRNAAAVKSPAELVWFTDVDHVFGEGCIDQLWSWWQSQTDWFSLAFPRQIWICKDHATGDRYAETCGEVIDPSDFVPKHYGRAIGGVQIVPGSLARRHGYLNDFPQHRRPSSRPFGDFRDDVKFRSWCGEQGRIARIPSLPVYRLRHTKTTYQGDTQ